MEPKETASDLWRRSLSSLKTVHWDQSKTGGHPAHKHQGQNLIKNVSLSRHPQNPTTNVKKNYVNSFLSNSASSSSHQPASPLCGHTHTAGFFQLRGVTFQIVLLTFYCGLSEHLPTEFNYQGAVTVEVRPKLSNMSWNARVTGTRLSLLLLLFRKSNVSVKRVWALLNQAFLRTQKCVC